MALRRLAGDEFIGRKLIRHQAAVSIIIATAK
jgi:hypothetical protein